MTVTELRSIEVEYIKPLIGVINGGKSQKFIGTIDAGEAFGTVEVIYYFDNVADLEELVELDEWDYRIEKVTNKKDPQQRVI